MSSHGMKPVILILFAVSIVLPGCTTRSISDSGYPDRWGGYGGSFARELSEFNVIGIEPSPSGADQPSVTPPSDVCKVSLKKGSGVILVQSGAFFPDDPMQREMSKHFQIAPFSGLIEKEAATTNYSKGLREAAARGGYPSIVCYWGVLETTQKNLATKGASWVPIVGRVLPDEAQQMRIRLKAIIVDVASGQWAIVVPPPFEDMAISGRLTRKQSDQSQVEQLKEKAYATLVEQLLKTCS